MTYDAYEDFPYDPAVDPWLGGGDPAMQEALLAIMLNQDPNYLNATMPTFDMGQVQAGAGLVPQYQPSGEPLTVAQQNTAFNAQRSSLHDTALIGALAGPQAFAANAFDPIVTSSIRQDPALQQVYGYLRSPTSVEGIITQELMNGGTPSTAARNLRQIFTKTDEEVAAMFAEYDAIFGRQPSVTVADVPRIRENLLMELPPQRDPNGNPMPITPEGGGVDWNFTDDYSVQATAESINELNAQIPRVGPSGPQYDRNGIQISAGGELQWGVDETGAPVLVETTSTPSEASQTFIDLGLPSPAEQYTTQDFLSPQLQEEQALYAQDYLPAYRELMARLDPFAESPFAEISPEMRAAAANAPPVTPPGATTAEVEAALTDRGIYPGTWGSWNVTNPLVDRVDVPPDQRTGYQWGDWNVTNADVDRVDVPPDQRTGYQWGDWNYWNQQPGESVDLPPDQRPGVYQYGDWNYPTGTAPPVVPTPPAVTPPAAAPGTIMSPAGVPYTPRGTVPGVPYGQWNVDNPQVQGLMGSTTLGTNGQLPTGAESRQVGRSELTAAEVNAILNRLFTGEEPPPEPVDWTTDLPTPGELNRLTTAPYDPLSSIQPRGGSGVRSSMEDFLAQGPAGGFPTPGGPGYTQGAAEQARQPGGPGTPGAQNPTVAAMLAQMLASGASAGQPVRPRLDYGSSEGPAYTDYLATLPPYAQPGAEQARQPGGPGTPGTPSTRTGGPPVPSIITGEAAPTRTASGTGWYGDRSVTGEEPARQPMHEMQGEDRETRLRRSGITARRQQQRHEAVFAKREEDKRLYGEEYGRAWGEAYALRREGVRPIDQALMARRLALMAAGQPAGRIPGT